MPPLHRLILLSLALGATPAFAASTAGEAEHTRLADEMKRLSGRNAWKGVDDAYKRLEALAADEGLTLTYRDHFLGASAARELGDINAVYTRLQRALALEKTEEVTSWLADLNQNFGQISLRIDSKYPGDRSLSISEMPFDPAQRRVIEAAQLALQQSRTYQGILPLGSYTFGDKTFTIDAGGAAAKEYVLEAQSVRGGSDGGGGLSYAGPRIDLGLSFSKVQTTGDVAEVDDFAGVGGRIGLGWEIGFSTKVGLVAQVGYHNLFGAGGEHLVQDANGWVVDTGRNNLHLGYGWLAGALRLGDLRLAAGPTIALGRFEGHSSGTYEAATGVEEYTQSVNGSFYGPGAELGVFYGFTNFGKLQSGIGLHAGAYTDDARMYPWAQLAFTIAPAAYAPTNRRDG